MAEERLVGLALLNGHKDIIINPCNIIDRFANSGNQKKIFYLINYLLHIVFFSFKTDQTVYFRKPPSIRLDHPP